MNELKLSLKMNSQAMALFLAQKKKKEQKLVCKRKRDARRRFQGMVIEKFCDWMINLSAINTNG